MENPSSYVFQNFGSHHYRTEFRYLCMYFEALVTTLLSGREYEFMVLCKDNNGDGLFSKSIRVWTKGIDGESDRYRSNSFPPVGFPRNISVYPTERGFVVTWEPPEYGTENLKFYVVRWFQGPEDYLFGSAETKNTSYLRKSQSLQ